MPSMAFFVVSNPSHHDINVSFPRIQFSIFSTRHSETKEISKFLKDSLNRFKGKLGNTDVIQIVYQNEYENYESDTGLRSEEHTSELQSRGHLVCRLLLRKKKKK